MQEIERLIQLLARLPGLGPRSARRAALQMIKKPETMMEPLARALSEAAAAIVAAAALRKVPGAEAPGADAFPPSAAARSVRRVFLASPLTAEFDFPREAHAMPPVMPLCPLSLEYLLQSVTGAGSEDPPAWG